MGLLASYRYSWPSTVITGGKPQQDGSRTFDWSRVFCSDAIIRGEVHDGSVGLSGPRSASPSRSRSIVGSGRRSHRFPVPAVVLHEQRVGAELDEVGIVERRDDALEVRLGECQQPTGGVHRDSVEQ